LSALLLAELEDEAGLPPGWLNVLVGPAAEIGDVIVEDDRVKLITFTGSSGVGWKLKERAPKKRVNLELGNATPVIVAGDADVSTAATKVAQNAFSFAGQSCISVQRVYVDRSIFDAFVQHLVPLVEALKVGNPADDDTDVGPVIDEEARAALETHKAHMRNEARELIDLPLVEDCTHGTYVAPAIYEIPSISVLKKEVFGPILHVVRFSGDRLGEVCDAINATGYGLTLGLHSRIKATADFVAERIKVGNMYVNRNQIGAVVGVQPFGGEGLSGTGPKAGGPNYLEAFAVERVRSTDLTASGGNASLLAAGSDEA
jgi:RHH-type proline utilization regulon transcriptional repressor/proline dehydrogenase/delta 1-pyrroline-5-carboxylate dehydrogenase